MGKIRFNFSLVPTGTSELSGFALGHLEAIGDQGRSSSLDRKPDQAMMLFVSICTLLDGLRAFVIQAKSGFEFIGVDCSFRIVFTRVKDRKIEVISDERVLTVIDISTLLAELYTSIMAFLNANMERLPRSDPVYQDIVDSIDAFHEMAASMP